MPRSALTWGCEMRIWERNGSRREPGLGRRGSVAIWIAAMIPGLFVAVSPAIEAGAWAAAQVSVQRAADLSAIAGGINYKITSNRQTAATFAARMAQLN